MAKLTAKARAKLPKESFALPEERMFPIHDAEHIEMAWKMLKRAKGLTADQRKAAAKVILAAAKKAEIDTSGWTEQAGIKTKKAGTATDAGTDDMDDMEMPEPEDLTVDTIGGLTDPKDLCAMWCLTHDLPLTSVQRASLTAAIQARCSDLNISMYSWDYYDGGTMAEMHEKMGGQTAADAAKAAPTLEAIGAMESIEDLRKAYVDVREAALTAEVRDGLESAIRSRCDTVGVNFWTWTKRGQAETVATDAAEVQFLTDSASGYDVMVGTAILLDAGDAATGRPLRARFRVTRKNFRNHNTFFYPEGHIEDAVAAANADIAAKAMVPGEMYHPDAYMARDGAVMFKSAFERQVFNWERFQLAPDGVVWGDAAILEHTPAGALIGGHIRKGVPVPVSVRWLTPNGATTKTLSDGSKAIVPNKPLRIKTVDAVPNPATEGSESVQMLDEAQVQAILAAPVEGAASVSAQLAEHEAYANPHAATAPASGTTTNDAGAPSAKEGDDTVTTAEILALLKTDEGKAALKEALGVNFDSVIQAAQNQETINAEKARQTAVKTVVDGAGETLKRFDTDTQQVITDAVLAAPDATQAKVILDNQVALADKFQAKFHTAKLGFPNGAAVGQVRVDSVTEGKPWRGAVDKLKAAFDDAARSQGNVPDPSLRKVNKRAVDALVARYEQQNGRALYDAAQSMADGALVLGDESRMAMADAATTTAVVLNQPIIQVAFVEQAFQDVEGLQFVTVRTDAEGGVFKVPSEYYTPAADAATGDLITAEQGAISEGNVGLAWLTFSPDWRRIATRLTQDVIRELKAGPARYDVLGRSLYHIPREKGRVVDLAIYREMLVTSDEYAAVALSNQSENLAPAAGADGTNVAYVYTLKRGTADGATRAPVVRPRTVNSLDANGNKTATVRNAFTLKAGSTTLTRGYLDASGNIQPTAADYAVAWETGKVYIKSGKGIDPDAATPVHPTVSYSYATNFDSFNVNNGSTVASQYFNDLLLRLDQTAALMGSAPRFKKPTVALMSLNSATYFTNAGVFYKLNSPQGTELLSDQTFFGNRNGVNLARINAPWDAGDGRIMLTQIGATQYGVDTPFEMEGPVQAYVVDGTEVKVKDEKIWYGREHSAIYTPQVTDASGNVLNPFLRSIMLYKA